jgi:hypothetical protein
MASQGDDGGRAVNGGEWQRVRVLFETACELTPQERRRWLAGACDDEAICAEVESIVAASESASWRFEEPLAESFPDLLSA